MPRVRTPDKDIAVFKTTGDWDALSRAESIQNKREVGNPQLPGKLYHGSPYKLKKGTKLEPKGPIFYGVDRKGLAATSKFGEAARSYAMESDHGGINKTRFGKSVKPGTFSTKGYVYEMHAQTGQGWFKQYHGGSARAPHWGSYKAQQFDKRHTVRHKGKLPITKREAAVIGGVVVAAGSYGAYRHFQKRKKADRATPGNFYYRTQNNKRVRVKKSR